MEGHAMQARYSSSKTDTLLDEPISERMGTQSTVQPRAHKRLLPIESVHCHLFAPQKAHDPLLDSAYEVWRDSWLATFEELDGLTRLHSDDFARQDEIAVLAAEGRCVSLMGLRCLDLGLARSREDSYFEHWPADAVAALGDRIVGITSNLVVHPEWRGGVIETKCAEPMRLSSAMISLSVRRLFASAAQCVIALTRNDRAVHRMAAALGATKLSQIRMHGVETDVIRFLRSRAVTRGPVADQLWERRHQG
jgi:hypothetical protein